MLSGPVFTQHNNIFELLFFFYRVQVTDGVTEGADRSLPWGAVVTCPLTGLKCSLGAFLSCGFLLGAASCTRAPKWAVRKRRQEADLPDLGFQHSLCSAVFWRGVPLKLMHFDNAVWECTRNWSGNASPCNGLIEVVGLSVILQSSRVSSPWRHMAWPCKPSPDGQPPRENAGGRENQSSPK